MICVMQGVLGLASGTLVGFSLGLVGGGGSILAVPRAKLAGLFVAGGIAGGLLGTKLARLVSARRGALNIVFAVVIIAVALYMLARNVSLS